MSRMYATTFENVAITAAYTDVDLFHLDPADDKPIILHALYLSQVTDVGDANEEMMRIAVVRGNTTTGSTNGGTANEIPLDSADAAAGYVGNIHFSVPASAGTAVNLYTEAFNIRSGLGVVWTPETRPKAVEGDGFLCVRMLSTVGSTINMSGTVYVEEL